MGADVVVLCADLARNGAGRAVVLADLIRPLRRVTIAGWSSGPVWLPLLARDDLRVEVLESRWLPDRTTVQRWRDATVIAAKPLARSWGWSLLSAARTRILDIDDPELALARMDVRTALKSTFSMETFVLTAALLRARHRANAITVSNSELARRYGGIVIPHARDDARFGREEFRDRSKARGALGIQAHRPLITFVGTMRAHKGLRTLLRAAIAMPEVDVVIVGSDGAETRSPNVHFVGRLAYETAMQWVAAALIVVVPQSDGAIGRAQSPAKVVDAMAMGRAIVASELPPIVELGGSAIHYVPPDDPAALTDAVRALLSDSTERHRLEVAARERFLSAFSLSAVRPRMAAVIAAAELRSSALG